MEYIPGKDHRYPNTRLQAKKHPQRSPNDNLDFIQNFDEVDQQDFDQEDEEEADVHCTCELDLSFYCTFLCDNFGVVTYMEDNKILEGEERKVFKKVLHI